VTALAFLPGGLPGPLPVPELLRQPLSGGRVALRRGVAAVLRQRRSPDPTRVAAALVPVLEGLFDLAFGGTARPETPPEDAFALRWLGETLSDPDEAARASAAAARLFQTWGQPAAAREVLAAAERRGPRAGPAARALLCWADADILLATGAVGAAGQRQRDASTLLREAGDLELLATHLRRWGDNQYARGAPQAAASFYREARALYRQAGNQAGVGATLRGAGDAAVASGELLTSVDLYEQAGSTAATPVESANRLLGLATLSMARSELGAARRQLDEADRVEAGSVLLRANLTRRRADLSLRRGRSEEAIALADQAVAMYCAIGERGAEAATLRLRGDAQATRGQLQQAAQSYAEACALQVRTADVPGLRRTLSHAIALEQSSGDPEADRELRALLHELR
jgi:tetratricopeptide (TPR) repeat protein